MRILYDPNPLCSVVDLDPMDVALLRLKITVEELTERIYEAHFHLEPGERFSIEAARRSLDPDTLEGSFENRVQELLDYSIDALRSEHAGDCTCLPASCLKCHAEQFLGINTIAGLGKHQAHKVQGAFTKGRTLDDVIAYLMDYKPIRSESWMNFSQEHFDQYVPRWTEQARQAAEWLMNYRQTVFPA